MGIGMPINQSRMPRMGAFLRSLGRDGPWPRNVRTPAKFLGSGRDHVAARLKRVDEPQLLLGCDTREDIG